MNKAVTLSSGFIVFNFNGNFKPIEKEQDILKDIITINRLDLGAFNRDALIAKGVQVNPLVNELYTEYSTTGSFESYLKIIELIYESVSQVNVNVWVNTQFTDSKVSSLTKTYLLDMLKGLATNNTPNFKVSMPFNLRFGSEALAKNNDIYVKESNELFKRHLSKDWKTFMNKLVERKMLIEFYKLVFVDFY